MKYYLFLSYLLNTLLVLAQHARHLQSIPYQQSQQVDALCKKWDKKNTAGLALAILKNGKVIYQQEYGMSILEENLEINDSTIFHVASLAKQFTAFSILLLEEQGKLNLDDDVRKYIPELPQFKSTITLRQLANHTSGLRDQWELLELSGKGQQIITKQAVFNLLKNQQDLNFKAGQQYMYSNTGSFLLAEVIERVSNKSLIDFTQKHIFGPLEMKNTFFAKNQQNLSKQCAKSYYWKGKKQVKKEWNCQVIGPTNLKITTTDLAKWILNFSIGKVGNRTIFNKMKSVAFTQNSNHSGLGIFNYSYRGLNMFVHSGGDAGFKSYMAQIPSEDFAIIILGNTMEINPEILAMNMIDIYLKEKEHNILPSKGVTKKLLKKYEGKYRLVNGFEFTISENKNQLFIQGLGQNKYSMTALSDSTFFINNIKIEGTLLFSKNNKVRLNQGFTVFEGTKKNTINIELNDFEGMYYSEELDITCKIIKDSRKLYLFHEMIGKIPLTTLQKNVFFWRKFKLEFKNNHFFLSTSRVKNIIFSKK